MKELWINILKTVNSAPLNKVEKKRVLERLDTDLGTYIIEDHIPIKQGDLTENEFLVYRDVIKSLWS
jgi:hypothetical protein